MKLIRLMLVVFAIGFTANSMATVKVMPTPKNETEAAEDTRQRNEKAELDRKLVDFNGDVAYYTKVLAWVKAQVSPILLYRPFASHYAGAL